MFLSFLILAQAPAITTVHMVNWTVIIPTIFGCIAAMGTIIKIWGAKRKPEELPGTSPHCAQHKELINKIELKEVFFMVCLSTIVILDIMQTHYLLRIGICHAPQTDI